MMQSNGKKRFNASVSTRPIVVLAIYIYETVDSAAPIKPANGIFKNKKVYTKG